MNRMKELLIKARIGFLSKREFQKISIEEAAEIVDNREPLGKFWTYTKEDKLYYGLDNAGGHAYVESFRTKRECFKWLDNKPAVDSQGYLHEH